MLKASIAFVVLGFVLSGAALGQSVAPGHRLVPPLTSTDTFLVDVNGNTVHTWSSTFTAGISAYLDDDGILWRAIRTVGPVGLAGVGGGIQKLAFDGTVLWQFNYDGPGVLSHHDIEVLPNGNVLMMAWEDKTVAEATAAGFDPASLSGSVLRPDHINEVSPTGPTTGSIVWEWHVWDHLIQDLIPAKRTLGSSRIIRS